MNVLRLNDHISLTLDVADWMRRSGRFNAIRSSDGREWIGATCPFHDDRHPSFAVNSETGAYKCQACGASGNFVNLVKHVEEHDTAYDAEQSLIARFARYVPATDEALQLDFGDKREEETFVETIQTWFSAYLADKRGINQRTQAIFEAGEVDGKPDVIALPWLDRGGRIVTVKHRSIVDKRFWYDPPISPGRLRRMLYGMHVETTQRAPLLVVCEGEIDAMSVVQAGFAAVALGGASLSTTQADMLRNHACDEVVVFTDNDVAGRKVRAAIVDALVGSKRVSVVDWSGIYDDNSSTIGSVAKDANDVLRRFSEDGIEAMIEHRVLVGLSLKLDK